MLVAPKAQAAPGDLQETRATRLHNLKAGAGANSHFSHAANPRGLALDIGYHAPSAVRQTFEWNDGIHGCERPGAGY